MGLEIIFTIHFGGTFPETNSSHLKIGRAPKGNDLHFQVLCHVSFGGCFPLFLGKHPYLSRWPAVMDSRCQPAVTPRFRSDGFGSNDVSGESSLSCKSHPPVLKKRPVKEGSLHQPQGDTYTLGSTHLAGWKMSPLNEDVFPI